MRVGGGEVQRNNESAKQHQSNPASCSASRIFCCLSGGNGATGDRLGPTGLPSDGRQPGSLSEWRLTQLRPHGFVSVGNPFDGTPRVTTAG